MYNDDIPRFERIERLEKKMYNEIKDYINKKKRSPTVREITRICNMNSTSTTLEYMRRLKMKGYINWEPRQSRTIQITGDYIQKSS